MRAQVYDPTTKTPAEWRAMAARNLEKERESFERCDTDGFLSQWAHSQMAQRYFTLAQIAENDGITTFVRLADLDGNLLDAKEVKGKYGMSWRIWDEETRTVRWFTESKSRKEATRMANNAKKGYKFVVLHQRAVMVDGDILPMRGTEPVEITDFVETDY